MSTITITHDHVKFLQGNRIFLNSTGTYEATWLKVGSNYNTVGKTVIEPYSGIFAGLRLSSIGSFSYSKSYFPPQYFIVGRYCAIAQRAQVIPGNHPVDRVSMGGFDYSRAAPFGNFEADRGVAARKVTPKVTSEMTIVGHDVWIGQDVMIKRGVKIGTGAVIGARSIVTKDVEPYAVMAGSPAVVKKFRFSEPLIERLLASEWWRYSYDQFAGMDTTDPLEFLPALEDAKAAGRLTVFEEKRIDVHAAFRAISKKMAA